MYVIAISGPEQSRDAVEAALELADVETLEPTHPHVMNWGARFPDEKSDWITVQAADVDAIGAIIAEEKWGVRVHYRVPNRPAKALTVEDRITALEAEIQKLKVEVA